MNGLGHVAGEWQAGIRSEALDFNARQENFVTHELLPLLKKYSFPVRSRYNYLPVTITFYSQREIILRASATSRSHLKSDSLAGC